MANASSAPVTMTTRGAWFWMLLIPSPASMRAFYTWTWWTKICEAGKFVGKTLHNYQVVDYKDDAVDSLLLEL
jgi:hypothetical protein